MCMNPVTVSAQDATLSNLLFEASNVITRVRHLTNRPTLLFGVNMIEVKSYGVVESALNTLFVFQVSCDKTLILISLPFVLFGKILASSFAVSIPVVI